MYGKYLLKNDIKKNKKSNVEPRKSTWKDVKRNIEFEMMINRIFIKSRKTEKDETN